MARKIASGTGTGTETETETGTETESESETETQAAKPRGIPSGSHSGGRLTEGIPFPTDDERFWVMHPERAFGTQHTIDHMIAAVDEVLEVYPDCPALTIGDISRERGGYFSPHMSHQAGLDVDFGPYWANGRVQPLRSMRPEAMDLDRTWALLEALVADESVQYIILDYKLQKVFYEYAAELPWMDDEYLELIFQYPRGPKASGIIRHWEGHYSHFHVRFYCPPEFGSGCSPTAP
jgi:penicillin-insensitive murein endopeptidase